MAGTAPPPPPKKTPSGRGVTKVKKSVAVSEVVALRRRDADVLQVKSVSPQKLLAAASAVANSPRAGGTPYGKCAKRIVRYATNPSNTPQEKAEDPQPVDGTIRPAEVRCRHEGGDKCGYCKAKKKPCVPVSTVECLAKSWRSLTNA